MVKLNFQNPKTKEELLLEKNALDHPDLDYESKVKVYYDTNKNPYLNESTENFIDGVNLSVRQYVSGIHVSLDLSQLFNYTLKYNRSEQSEILARIQEAFEEVSSRYYTYKMGKIDFIAFDYQLTMQMLWERLIELTVCKRGEYGLYKYR
jgi:hypothetical protein